MKRCPECRKDYLDDTLLFCLDDGTSLVQGSVTDEPATAILSGGHRSGEALTAVLKADGTVRQSGPVTLRLPSFLSWERLPWAIAGICLVALGVSLLFTIKNSRQPRKTEAATTSFYVSPPDKSTGFNQLTISPDGRQLAFIASSDAKSLLWLRPLDSFEARPLAGTEGVAGFPFWSFDGRSIFFQTPGKLKRVDLADGTVQTLSDIINDIRGFGGTTAPDGTVLFFNGGTGILKITATDTKPAVLPGYEPGIDHVDRWPHFLPDGKHFLFLNTGNEQARSMVCVGSTASADRKQIVAADSNAIFTRSASGAGFIFFVRDGALLAQGFDTETNSTMGEAFRVSEKIRVNINSRAYFSVSDNATLVYDPFGEGEMRQMAWFDRSGKQIETIGKEALNQRLRLSPDQRFVAITRKMDDGVLNDLVILDIARGSTSRLNSADVNVTEARWSPDSSRIVFSVKKGDTWQMIQKLASGAGQQEVLLESKDFIFPESWSPDGRSILFVKLDITSKRDMWILPLDGGRTPFVYFKTPVEERRGVFSPDGKFVAYYSDESGRDEVYVQTFPASASKWTVSTAGGLNPVWRADGKELFYVQTDGKMMSVDVKLGSTFEAGIPKPLFDVSAARSQAANDFNVSADGQRFLFLSGLTEKGMSPLAVIVNWNPETRR